LKDYSDLELTALIRAGRRDAFNEIYDRYWLKIFTAAVKRVRSRDDAKDLVQDLFFTLWTKRESLVVNTSLSAYLFTAIKYKVINYIESNIVKENYLRSLDAVLIDYDNSANEAIMSRDLEEFLDDRINDLSPKVKEVFQLSRNENLSIKEIAERLHLSDQTVKNQISKALKILRVHLSDISALFLFFTSLY
jgi:RNA polymerase sigma-70 factor (family 1)